MKTLVLVGSGEFTESMIETDVNVINLAKKNSKRERISVAIIPTASVPDGKQKNWIDDGIQHFKKLRVNPFGLNIVNRKDANKKVFLKKLKSADIIHFSGGHPGYLLETIKDTEIWKMIENLYESGVTLSGSSAGAMIMGSYLLANAQAAFDKGNKPKWIKGFNLVPYTIFPHFDWVQKNKRELFKKVPDSVPKAIRQSWMGIDEDTALIISNAKKTEIMGKSSLTIQTVNKSLKHYSGQEFVIHIKG